MGSSDDTLRMLEQEVPPGIGKSIGFFDVVLFTTDKVRQIGMPERTDGSVQAQQPAVQGAGRSDFERLRSSRNLGRRRLERTPVIFKSVTRISEKCQ